MFLETMLCLSMAIYHEARGEGLKGMVAVGQTIINREYSSKFPDTICGVVTQPGQFAFKWTPPRNKHSWQQAINISYSLLESNLADPSKGALYYYARDSPTPPWAKHLRITTVINHHVFLK